MARFGWIILALLALGILSGCAAGGTSQNEMEQVRKEMGTEAYEDAMRKAGRGAELDAQKAADEARRSADGG